MFEGSELSNSQLVSQWIQQPMMRQVSWIHFVGIGGSGMNGIAEVLANQGYTVSGSDIQKSLLTERLSSLGIKIQYNHEPQYIKKADVVVISSAIDLSNQELLYAKSQNITVVPRAQMLAELMRFRHGIAIAGTHGKTTTTSLVASLFGEAGLDPTYVIGGKLNSTGTNARLGTGPYLVVEADESDASFLHLKPMVAAVTNIEADHMQTYQGDFGKLKSVFIEFLHHLPFYGLAVLCTDDETVNNIMAEVNRPVVTYGLNDSAMFRATQIEQKGFQTHFLLHRYNHSTTLPIQLNLPGEHNVLNALAAIAIAVEHGVPDDVIQRVLANFQGIGRRIQLLGEYQTDAGQALLIDDYGHHPSELKATVAAIRKGWPDRRVVMVFQPHRYTRTRDLFDDFVDVLSGVDELVLLDVYAAGEAPLSGADSKALARGIRQRGKVEPVLLSGQEELMQELKTVLAKLIKTNDILLTQGAGNVGRIAASLMQSEPT